MKAGEYRLRSERKLFLEMEKNTCFCLIFAVYTNKKKQGKSIQTAAITFITGYPLVYTDLCVCVHARACERDGDRINAKKQTYILKKHIVLF